MAYKLAATKVWKGAMVGVDATGYLRPMNPATANLKFVGMANETVDNAAGNAGDKSVNVTKTGSFVLKAASGYTPAITELGKEAYAASDWETNSSATGLTNAYKIGTIVAVETSATGSPGARVRIDNYTV
jgi:hypothetical protein